MAHLRRVELCEGSDDVIEAREEHEKVIVNVYPYIERIHRYMVRDRTTGRWPELERLVGGLGRAAGGEGRCYGIWGSPGTRKTYLLRRLERAAEGLGFEVLRGRGGPGAAPEEVFSPLLLPNTRVSRDQLPLALLDRLSAASSRAVLITLNDFHLAHPASVPMLVFLSRNIARHPVMIVITYDDGIMGSRDGGAHPLVDGLRILAREGAFEELRLNNLSRPALEKVLDEEFMGPLDGTLANLIWDRSEGNLMVAIEEVRLLIQSHQVERREGSWRAVRALELELPDDYTAFVRSRIDLLDPEDRETLTVAAVIGRTFDPRIIAIVQSRDLLEVLERLDRIVHDHRLLEESGERYRFSTGAVRSVLLDELPPSTVKGIHGRIGTVLEGGVLMDTSFDDLSEHYYRAERAEKCVCFSLLAGQRALTERNYQRARDHFQKVLDAAGEGGHREERLLSIEGIADAEMAMGRGGQARYWYNLLLQEPLSPIVRERVLRKLS